MFGKLIPCNVSRVPANNLSCQRRGAFCLLLSISQPSLTKKGWVSLVAYKKRCSYAHCRHPSECVSMSMNIDDHIGMQSELLCIHVRWHICEKVTLIVWLCEDEFGEETGSPGCSHSLSTWMTADHRAQKGRPLTRQLSQWEKPLYCNKCVTNQHYVLGSEDEKCYEKIYKCFLWGEKNKGTQNGVKIGTANFFM